MGAVPGQQGEPVLLGEVPGEGGVAAVAPGEGRHPGRRQLAVILQAAPHPRQLVQHHPSVVALDMSRSASLIIGLTSYFLGDLGFFGV